jgi:hypothetical protein
MSELQRIRLLRTWVNGPRPCSKRRGLEKVSRILYLQMEPLFALCHCGVAWTPQEVIAVP